MGSSGLRQCFQTKEFDVIVRMAVLIGEDANSIRSCLLSC